MADPLIPGIDSSVIFSGADAITQFIYWIVGIGIVGFLTWILQYYLQFKIQATVFEEIQGTVIIRSEKIRVFKSKTGIPKWQLWTSLFRIKKDVIPIPNYVYLSLTAKGKKHVFLAKTTNGEYKTVRPNPDNWKTVQVEGKKVLEFDEFTATQRSMLIQEHREAELYKPRDWTPTILLGGAAMTVVMILAVFLIFFDQAVAPTIGFGQQVGGYCEDFTNTCNTAITQCQQTITHLSAILNKVDPAALAQIQTTQGANVLPGNVNISGNGSYTRIPN